MTAFDPTYGVEIEGLVVFLVVAAMVWRGKLKGDGHLLEFIKLNFDKLLLFVVFVGCMLYVRRSIAFGVDDAFINWAQGVTGQVLAALLTLMVGMRNVPRNGDSDPKKAQSATLTLTPTSPSTPDVGGGK